MTLKYTLQEKGFSLVELLMVTMLLAVMTSILYGTLTGIIRGKNLIEEQKSTTRVAQYVLGRMVRELSGRVREPLSDYVDEENAEEESIEATEENPAGTKGAEYLRGENGKKGQYDSDKLRFVSSRAGQAYYGSLSNYGMVEVEYSLQDDPQSDKISLNDEKSLVLVRVEQPAGVKNTDIIKERIVRFPISENIVSLNFRYRKNGAWEDSWSEAQSILPEAVEISIKLKTDGGRVETYKTAVALRQATKTGAPR